MKKLISTSLSALLCFSINAQINKALDLNGSFSFASGNNINNLGEDDFTIEAWIYVDKITHPSNKIINKGLSSAGSPMNAGYALRIGYFKPGELDFTIGGADGKTYVIKYNSLEHEKWYHVAGVRDDKKMYLYVNGKEVGTKTLDKVVNVNTNLPFTVGAIHKGWKSTANEFFDGMIDEARVWKMARSEKEINETMNLSITKPKKGLWASYTMDDDGGNVLKDLSGVGNHLDLNGSYKRVDPSSDRTGMYLVEDDYEIEELDIVIEVPDEPFEVSYNNENKELIIRGTSWSLIYYIYNMDGEEVKTGLCNDERKILVNDLEKGTYFLRVPSNLTKDLFKFEVK